MAGKRVDLCIMDIHKFINKAHKTSILRFFELPKPIQFNAYLEIEEKLFTKIQYDDKLLNAIHDGVNKQRLWAIDTINKEVAKAEAAATEFLGSLPVKAAKQKIQSRQVLLEKDIKDAMEFAMGKMKVHALKMIEKWKGVRKDRNKYKIKAFVNVVLGAGGVVTASIGTAGAVGTGGAGVGVAIYGLAKSILNLAKKLVKLAQGFDKAKKDLDKLLLNLKTKYEEASRKSVAKSELTAVVFERLLVVEKSSISKCEKQLKLYNGKLTGIDIKASDCGAKLNNMLDKQLAIRDLIRKQLGDRRRPYYSSKRLPKLQNSLKKLIKLTNKQIKSMEQLYAKIKEGYTSSNEYSNSLNLLKQKKPKWVDKVAFLTAAIDLSAYAVGFEDNAETIGRLIADISNELVSAKTDDVL